MVTEPVAAAIGAGIDITKPCGNLVVDIGGGTTDIGLISIGDAVVMDTLRTAGSSFDDAIIRYLRRTHSLFIAPGAAEEVKMQIGSAFTGPGPRSMEVHGRNVITGLPAVVSITQEELRQAIREPMEKIVEAVHATLEKTPPALAADVVERGIVLTGGGALLSGLEERIEERTGINVMTAENPAHCVANGTGKYMEMMDLLGK